MGKNNSRFQKIYSQGTLEVFEIWVDTETGVHYLYHRSGYSGGLTPLLDADRSFPRKAFWKRHGNKWYLRENEMEEEIR